MLQEVKSAEARWQERVAARGLLASSKFPGNPLAVIFQPARSPMTSRGARRGQWKLRFEPQSPPFIEPLMGWTGSENTLSQIELTFPTAEAAVAYARRQGLRYELRGSDAPDWSIFSIADRQATHAAPRCARQLGWLERTLEPDQTRQGPPGGSNPSLRYASPREVLRDVDLSLAAKRDVLHRWAFDLVEEVLSKPHNELRERLLDATIDALLDLDEKISRLVPAEAASTNFAA